MKMTKRILAFVLAIATVLSVSVISLTASAANVSASLGYNEPENSGDYAYWNGSKVVKSSSTTKDEIKWMQAALNYCIRNKGLNASILTIDGSFGPACKKATLAFQKKYGLSQDGSFGPTTIKKMKSVLDSGSSSSNVGSSKTLPINWNLIKKTGKQSVSGPCGCYAFAYCRDIIDGSQHYWTQYSEGYLKSKGRYSYSFVASKASYNKKTSSSEANVYKAVYDNIRNGKPVVINVKGGRSSGCHYVAVVGYVNVTNTSNLSASNFLIIDSAGGGYNTENLGSLKYSLRKPSGGSYTYYVD